MKRHIFSFALIVLCLVSCTSKSTDNNKEVTNQITFCGVPLSGHIDDFTKKLASEGVKPNERINSQLDDGARAYDVKNFGYPCMARVEYNRVTRNVYEATLMFTIQSTLSDFQAFRDKFSDELKEKYNKGVFLLQSELVDNTPNSYVFSDFSAFKYIIYNAQTNDLVGEIYFYWDAKDFDMVKSSGTFMLHVMYRNNEAPSFDQQMEKFY